MQTSNPFVRDKFCRTLALTVALVLLISASVGDCYRKNRHSETTSVKPIGGNVQTTALPSTTATGTTTTTTTTSIKPSSVSTLAPALLAAVTTTTTTTTTTPTTKAAPVNIEIKTGARALDGTSKVPSIDISLSIDDEIRTDWQLLSLERTCGTNRKDTRKPRLRRDAWDGTRIRADSEFDMTNQGVDELSSNSATGVVDQQFAVGTIDDTIKHRRRCEPRASAVEPHHYQMNYHSLPGPRYLESNCGKFEAGDFPSVAQFETKLGVHCGAVIVGPSLLLTSAFCATSLRKPTAIQLGLGESSEQPRATVVRGYCLHKQYKLLTNNTTPEGTTITDWNEVVKKHDLALLITHEAMRFDTHVASVCLNTASAPNRTRFAGASLGFNRFGNKDHIHYVLNELLGDADEKQTKQAQPPAPAPATTPQPSSAAAAAAAPLSAAPNTTTVAVNVNPIVSYSCPACSSVLCPHHVNVYFSGWPLFYYDTDTNRWHLKGIASRTRRSAGADPFKSFCSKSSTEDAGPEFIYTNLHHYGPKLIDSLTKCHKL